MSKVNIFVAKSDVSQFFSQKQQFLIYQNIQQNFGKKASFWNKILYYFGEKEIKQQVSDKINKDLQEKVSKNMFFDEEINSLVHRSHIEQYYPISKQSCFGNNKQGPEDETLNKEINDFVLRNGDYQNNEISISKISKFLTRFLNKTGLESNGLKKDRSGIIGSDILSQILLYRANADIAKLVKINGKSGEKPDESKTGFLPSQEGQNKTDISVGNSNLLQQCISFEQTYQELPFVFRLLGLSEITEESVQKVIDNVDKFDLLLQPNYHIILNNIEVQAPAGEVNEKNNIYRNGTVKVGQGRKNLPWWTKILVSLVFFGGTAYLGGSTLIFLPIFVFARQYFKTSADLYEGQQHNLNMILRKDDEYISKLNTMFQQKDNLNFSQKRWIKDNYDTVPLLLTKHRVSAEKALSMLSTYITQRNISKIKELLQMIIARLGAGYESGISLLSFHDQEKKELTMLKLYKNLILGGVIVGWNLSNENDFTSIQAGDVYQEIVSNSNIYLSSALKKYQKRTFGKSIQDGFISAIVAGFTGWISSELLNPAKTIASVYASDTMTKIALDKNSPLWDILHKSGVSGDTTNKTITELTKIIDNNKDYYMSGNDIYEHGGLVVDDKLTGLKHIVPNDVREHLLDLVKTGKTDYTLRETMTRMSGDNRGNEFTQQLVDELWKSQDSDGLSELFQLAKQNGLEVDITSTKRTRVMKILDNVYDYEGFGQYRQFVDKEWLSVHLDKIISGEVNAEQLSHYTSEQRSVLSQTAFIYVHKEDFEELFFDQISGGKIGQLTELTENEISLTGSLPSQGGRDSFNFDGFENVGIKSVPLSFGRNRIVEEME